MSRSSQSKNSISSSQHLVKKLSSFSWMTKLAHYFTHTLAEPKFGFKLPGPWFRMSARSPPQMKYNQASTYIAYISETQKEVIVLDSISGNLIARLKPMHPTALILAIEFHPSENWIFVGLTSHSIELRGIENNRLIREYKGSTHYEYIDIKCSKSGKYIIAASFNGLITLYQVHKPSTWVSNKNHHHPNLTEVFITDDEETLISTSFMEVRLWSVSKLDKCREVIRIPPGVHNLPIVVSPTHKHFFTNTNYYNISMYSVKTKEVVKVIEGNRKVKLVAFAVTKDEKILISLMSDGFIRFVNLLSMEEIALFKLEFYGEVESLLLPPNQKFFGVLFRDGSFQVWGLIDDMKTVFDQKDSSLFMPSCAFVVTHDQRYLIAGTQDGSIEITDLSIKSIVFSEDEPSKQPVTALILTKDEQNLISGDSSSFKVYTISRGDYIELYEQYRSPQLFGAVKELASICNNAFLAVGLTSNRIHIYDTRNYDLIQVLHGYWWRAHIVFNQLKGFFQKNEVAIGADDGSLSILEFKNEQFAVKERFPNLFSTPVTAVCVAEDFLVAGSQQGSLKIVFFTKNAIRNLPMIMDKSGIYSVDITPDEQHIIAASAYTVSLYDVRLQLEIHSYTLQNEIRKVLFMPTGKGIVIMCADGSIMIQMFPFFTDLNVIDYSLPVPYRASSTLPEFKLMKLWNHDIKMTPQFIQNFSAFYTNPYNINLWQYYFFTQDFEESPAVVKMIIDANIPILNDKDGKNIIHYLLKKKKRAVLNVIFKYADKAFQHSPPEVFESLSGILPEVIATALPALPSFLDACVGPPEIVEGRYLPRFGDATGQTPFILSLDRKLKPEIRKALVKDGIDPLTFYTSKISFDQDFSSEENVKLLETIFSYKDMNIYNSGLILKIIEWAWTKARPFLVFLVLDSFIFMGFVLSYAALGLKPFWLEMIVFIHNCFLVVHEFLQFLGNYKSYFQSIWNICDLLRLVLVFCCIGLRWKNDPTITDDDSNGLDDTIALLMILGFFFNYLKMVTFLRIFTATRRFIRLFVEIIKDMLPFIMLVALIDLGFSFISFQLDKDETFGNSVQKVYRMLFADFDSTTDFDVLEGTFFGIMSFLSAVVLMNLLVSFLGDTYDRVQANTVSSDYYEKLDLVLEYIYIKRTAKRILCMKKKRREADPDRRQRKYLFWVIETSADDEGGNDFGWEGRIRQTRKEFRKEIIEGNSEVDKQFDFVLRNLNTVRDVHEIMKKATRKQTKALGLMESKMGIMKEEISIFRGKLDLPLTLQPSVETLKLIPVQDFKGVTKTDIPEEGSVQNIVLFSDQDVVDDDGDFKRGTNR